MNQVKNIFLLVAIVAASFSPAVKAQEYGFECPVNGGGTGGPGFACASYFFYFSNSAQTIYQYSHFDMVGLHAYCYAWQCYSGGATCELQGSLPGTPDYQFKQFWCTSDCTAGQTVTSTYEWILGVGAENFSPPGLVCDNGCALTQSSAPLTNCNYTDTNLDGLTSTGETARCDIEYETTGDDCLTGESLPSGGGGGVPCFGDGASQCSDSTPIPESPGGGDGDPTDPGDSGGDDSQHDGGNSGGGDGDPDTPGAGDGTGDGDIDEDGDRDIDCNPLSNPDCAFAGSASSSAACGAPPSCSSSDPVECAILNQNYNVMCAILTAAANEQEIQKNKTASNSSNCVDEPVCTSNNVVECKAMIQTWRNACMFLDLHGEVAPWDDPNDIDWNRDLADDENLTEVDLQDGLDESGFATGSCPVPIGVSVFGQNISIDPTPLCDVAALVRIFVILMTLIWAAPYVVRSF